MIRLLALLLLPLLAACATLAAPPRAAFTSDRIGVTVRGSGPDVVLIPGLSSSPEVWESTMAALPGYRYHLVHVEPVAGEIERYISEAGLRQPAVVGHSLGGFWGMMVAARRPELVSRLMVIDMMPFMGAMFGGPNATPESVRPMAGQFRKGIASSAGRSGRRSPIRRSPA